MPVTGIGSWPGTSAEAAAREIIDVLGVLPFLPETPARPRHDMVSTVLGTDSPWAVPALPLADEVKIQLCGPVTLARATAMPLADAVALLRARIEAWLPDLRRALGDRACRLQLDEPMLGHADDASPVADVLSVHDGPTAVHCCATEPPWEALTATGADAVAVDVTCLDAAGWSALDRARLDVDVWFGALSATTPATANAAELGARVNATDVLTHTCGLAAAQDAPQRLRDLTTLADTLGVTR